MNFKVWRGLGLAVLAGLSTSAFSGPFGQGNLAVAVIGDGSAGLNNAATALFVNEFTTAGGLVQSIPMPTSVNGNNRRLTGSGTATSEGALTRSVDKRFLTLCGYDADPGTAGIAGTAVALANRVIGLVAADGTVDTTTALNDSYDKANIRSATSTDGSKFWTTGNLPNSTAGIRFTTYGNNTSVQLYGLNSRVANIFSDQLYVSSASGSYQGVSMVGTGLPETSGQTLTLLPGFPMSAGPSSYDYWFKDANTVYVCDDRTDGNGGIQRWTFDGSIWNLEYTLVYLPNVGTRQLTGTVDGSGNAVLYATTGEFSANNLVTVTDTGPASTFTVLATSNPNTLFRGVDWTPEAAGGGTALGHPTAYLVQQGTYVSGGVPELQDDDNQVLAIQQKAAFSAANPNVGVEITGQVATGSVSGLNLTVRATCTGVPLANIRFRIEAFNYSLNKYDIVRADAPPSGFGEQVYSLDLSNPASYVSNTGELKVRLRWFDRGSASPAWRSTIDQVLWTVSR